MERLPELSGPKDKQLDQTQCNSTWRDLLLGTHNTNFMLEEEQKIREELENDIERDLEEEIKGGICQLALRLHRLYQHKKDRNRPTSSKNSTTSPQSDPKNEVHMEVNITVKMDGGCKIELSENKPNTLHMFRPNSHRSKAKQGRTDCSTKQFDWSRTLHSGMSSVIAIGKNHGNLYLRNHNKPLKLVADSSAVGLQDISRN